MKIRWVLKSCVHGLQVTGFQETIFKHWVCNQRRDLGFQLGSCRLCKEDWLGARKESGVEAEMQMRGHESQLEPHGRWRGRPAFGESSSDLSMFFGDSDRGSWTAPSRTCQKLPTLSIWVQLAPMRSEGVDQHGQEMNLLDFRGSDASEVENEHKAVIKVGFLVVSLSCCGNGNGIVLWALTGRTKTEGKACFLLRASRWNGKHSWTSSSLKTEMRYSGRPRAKTAVSAIW